VAVPLGVGVGDSVDVGVGVFVRLGRLVAVMMIGGSVGITIGGCVIMIGGDVMMIGGCCTSVGGAGCVTITVMMIGLGLRAKGVSVIIKDGVMVGLAVALAVISA
jgi:hypothetical protein